MKKNSKKASTQTKARFALNGPYIFLLVSCENDRLKYPTGHKIADKKAWIPSTQRLDEKKFGKSANNHLSRLEVAVDSYFDDRKRLNKPVLKDELRGHLLAVEGKEEKIKLVKGNFFTGAATVVRLARSGEIKHGKESREYKSGTLRNWEKTIATLERFDPSLCFEAISIETYRSFIKWAELQKTKEKNEADKKLYSNNYIDALIKDWKSIMEIAKDQGIHSNNIHNDPKFKRINYKPVKIELTDKEIELLKKVKLTGLQEIIRDRFVMNLYLGFRISDLEKLTTNDIDGNKITIHYTEKTASKAVLPILPEVQEILDKYKGQFPRQYNRNVVNREIKVIAEKAGIIEKSEIREKRGGREIKGAEAMKDRFELISNHTGRRTAITNYLRMGVTVETLSKAMGVSEKTIREYYDKRTPTESADLMAAAYKQNKGKLRVA